MDRLIWTAWRAFWVGLGASAVLIVETLVGPAPVPAMPASALPAPAAPADDTRSAPVLSRNHTSRHATATRFHGES